MQITINRKNLANALNNVTKAVSSKPNIPVLSNVLLQVTQDRLRLAATNLDMGINMWISGLDSKAGQTTVSGKLFADFVNTANGDTVQLILEDDVLKVSTGKSKAEFQTIPGTEFPILPETSEKSFVNFDVVEFTKSMDKVIFACSNDTNTANIQFTGVLFEFEEGSKEVKFVGLNGFRLSQKVFKLSESMVESLQLIVPAKSLQEFVKVASTIEDDQIEIYINDSKTQIIFVIGEVEFSIRLLEGPYPDYKGVIPKEHTYSFEVSKEDFEKSLRVVNTFARTISGHKINWDLDIESQDLLMHTEVTDLGKNETTVKVSKTEGSNDLKDAYSLQFLMDLVGHIEGDKILFETNAPLEAAVFRDEKDKDFFHIIMPVMRDDV